MESEKTVIIETVVTLINGTVVYIYDEVKEAEEKLMDHMIYNKAKIDRQFKFIDPFGYTTCINNSKIVYVQSKYRPDISSLPESFISK